MSPPPPPSLPPRQSPPASTPSATATASAADVAALSLHSLRVELHRRNLPVTGLRPHLERVLLAALEAAAARAPSRAPPRRPRVADMPFLTVPPAFPAAAQPAAPDLSPPDAAVKTEPALAGTAGRVVGVLRARSVWVCTDSQTDRLWAAAGPLGKANLSRSAPQFAQPDAGDARHGRAQRQLMAMDSEVAGAAAMQAVRRDVEHLQLTLVEAFHAAFVQRVLSLRTRGGASLDDGAAAWRAFCAVDARFAPRFVAYCRYRAAGWLPRSGLKYGVDWVLYPASAARRHTHSPYCVVLKFRADGEAPLRLERRWITLQNRLRLVKNVSKALVIAEVYAKTPLSSTPSLKNAFTAVAITELTVDRWVP